MLVIIFPKDRSTKLLIPGNKKERAPGDIFPHYSSSKTAFPCFQNRWRRKRSTMKSMKHRTFAAKCLLGGYSACTCFLENEI